MFHAAALGIKGNQKVNGVNQSETCSFQLSFFKWLEGFALNSVRGPEIRTCVASRDADHIDIFNL